MLRPDQAKESRLEGFEGLDQSKRCCGEMSVMVMSSGKQWLESVRHMRFPKSVEIAAMSDVIAQSIRVQSCFLTPPNSQVDQAPNNGGSISFRQGRNFFEIVDESDHLPGVRDLQRGLVIVRCRWRGGTYHLNITGAAAARRNIADSFFALAGYPNPDRFKWGRLSVLRSVLHAKGFE